MKNPNNIEEALYAIIPVLHAPYNKGEYFIKLIIQHQEVVVKKGTDAQAGNENYPGSGKYILAVGC